LFNIDEPPPTGNTSLLPPPSPSRRFVSLSQIFSCQSFPDDFLIIGLHPLPLQLAVAVRGSFCLILYLKIVLKLFFY
jgi:hypothetical protein